MGLCRKRVKKASSMPIKVVVAKGIISSTSISTAVGNGKKYSRRITKEGAAYVGSGQNIESKEAALS